MRAELLSNHCCQGKICWKRLLQWDGELLHLVVTLRSLKSVDWITTCNHRSNGTWTWRSLTALYQQTRIYEAEYETEHNDHKHTLLENRRLRKKREEMRQQVALLQEQVASLCTHTTTNALLRECLDETLDRLINVFYFWQNVPLLQLNISE